MTMRAAKSSEFTGKHMLFLMIAFFGVVIAVNLTLATLARTSWTGLVVENSYVASQEFNERTAETKAQAALGWTGMLTLDGQGIGYRLVDRAGQPVAVETVTITLRRPAYAGEDRTLTLTRARDGAFALGGPVRDGLWIVEIDAAIAGKPPFREARRVVVRGGKLQ
jgi:nitrogen fixation protein FixH